MKPFEEQHYYEILDISPGASPFEIRNAYKMALQMYGNSSPVSYSFFSKDERARLLSILEKAFLTLIDKETRLKYDKKLVEQGIIDEESLYCEDSREPIPIIDLKRSKERISVASIPKSLKSEAASNPVIREILAQDVLTGEDLKKMREALGVSLENISEYTKIRIGFLNSIEEDQFDDLPSKFHLRSFLKSYLDCFHTDSESIIDRYMKRIDG
ncbi:MAG: helix-turn-helix domain-containing protein [Syntrophales bacterium]|nr:helix-turn-helix domain-containing protein [Syntrophales bacterium]